LLIQILFEFFRQHEIKLQPVQVTVDIPDVTVERRTVLGTCREGNTAEVAVLPLGRSSLALQTSCIVISTHRLCLTCPSVTAEIQVKHSVQVGPYSDLLIFTLFMFYFTTLLSSSSTITEVASADRLHTGRMWK